MKRDIITRSDNLDKRMDTAGSPDEMINDLVKYGRQNRRLIKWIFISVALDILLTASLSFVFLRQQHNQNSILATSNFVTAGCKSGNDIRAAEIKLWNYVLSFPPATPRTPAQNQQVADFKVFLDKTFAPRNCGTLK
jgi:hypothetical protein